MTTNETAEPSSANDSVSFKGDGSTNNSAANKTDRANEEPAQSNVKDNPACEADKDVCEAKSRQAKDPEVTKSEASHLKDDQSTETAPCECLKIAQADSAGGHKVSLIVVSLMQWNAIQLLIKNPVILEFLKPLENNLTVGLVVLNIPLMQHKCWTFFYFK